MSAGTAPVRRLLRELSGELQTERQGEQGYLMVALLVALSVMAIMMGAALPAWHTLVQREKEAELIFRGEQYSRAIGLWQRRFANAAPPSIDVLVEQRFLRKRYKDPITNSDFQILGAGGSLPGQTQSGLTGQAQQGRGAPQQAAGRGGAAVAVTQGRGSDNGIVGGIVGVTSKSAEKSLRLYNSRDTYNQWIFMPVARAGGAGGAGAGGRGGGGARGDGRGGDGRGVLDGRGRGPQGDGGRGGFDGRGRGPQGDGGRGDGGRGRGGGGQRGGGQAPPRGRF